MSGLHVIKHPCHLCNMRDHNYLVFFLIYCTSHVIIDVILREIMIYKLLCICCCVCQSDDIKYMAASENIGTSAIASIGKVGRGGVQALGCALEAWNTVNMAAQDCPICLCPVTAEEALALCCEHWFCRDCWAGYIKSQVGLRCTSLHCTLHLSLLYTAPLSTACRMLLAKFCCCSCFCCYLLFAKDLCMYFPSYKDQPLYTVYRWCLRRAL